MTRKREVATADHVWASLVTVVMDTRGDWRRRVVAATSMPFERYRALKRLQHGPLALHVLADAMTIDAPAATVTVIIEKRGLSGAPATSDQPSRQARVADARRARRGRQGPRRDRACAEAFRHCLRRHSRRLRARSTS